MHFFQFSCMLYTICYIMFFVWITSICIGLIYSLMNLKHFSFLILIKFQIKFNGSKTPKCPFFCKLMKSHCALNWCPKHRTLIKHSNSVTSYTCKGNKSVVDKRINELMVGVTKPMSSTIFSKFLTVINILIPYGISHSYLTGVTAAKLPWHLSNINMIERI